MGEPVIIDGKRIAAAVLDDLAAEVAELPVAPCINFVRVGEDPASVAYVGTKERTAAKLGIVSRTTVFPDDVSEAELFAHIDSLNADPEVHGILVQAPLPGHLNEQATFNRVAAHKDVDGFSNENLGLLVQEDPTAFVACTPAGIVELLKRSDIDPSGKHVVVLGRSLIVGKPAGLLFMRKAEMANATVTVCHSRTKDLPSLTRQADILIAAIGRPHYVTKDMVKAGAVVVDVGINRVDDATRKRGYRLVGDVDFDAVAPHTAAITPVPGGVGQMTVAMLMVNTVKAAKLAVDRSA